MALKILLLEDDIALSQTVEAFLRHKGYEVVCVYDGYEAEAAAYEQEFALLLLDIKVPHENGVELLRRLRKQGDDTPAIFITSLHGVDDVEKGFEAGGDDYIRKPFALKELVVRIEALLKRRYGTQEHAIDLGEGLVFDTRAQLLLQNGKRVALKNKELRLLSLFLRHPNRLLEYETIYEALWDFSEEPSGGSLRAYVKSLRAVLGKERIETLKNRGYRFVAQRTA